MSGTKAGWTPERRAAQAERMRAMNADPVITAHRNERSAKSEKALASRRRNLMKIMQSPVAREKSKAWLRSPAGKALLSQNGYRLGELRRTDPELNQRWRSAVAVYNSSSRKRAFSGEQLRRLHQKEDFRERQTARLRLLAKCPKARANMAATRKAGKIPEGRGKRYRQLRDMIGAVAAMRIVHREAKMAMVNR